jgi:hypothetical protein
MHVVLFVTKFNLPHVKAKINSKRFRQWYVTIRVAGLLDFAQCLVFRTNYILGEKHLFTYTSDKNKFSANI